MLILQSWMDFLEIANLACETFLEKSLTLIFFWLHDTLYKHKHEQVLRRPRVAANKHQQSTQQTLTGRKHQNHSTKPTSHRSPVTMTRSNGKPPRSPSSTAGSTGSSGRSNGNKTSRGTNSNSPSSSATNGNGEWELDRRLRSVLSHPMGLPLAFAFKDDESPPQEQTKLYDKFKEMGFENMKSTFLEDKLGNVLAKGIDKKPKSEVELTKGMTEEINGIFEKIKRSSGDDYKLHAHDEVGVIVKTTGIKGRMDITFTQASDKNDLEESTPCMIVEVGLAAEDWFKKLSQGIKYLNFMRQGQKQRGCAQFESPMLLAVITMKQEAMTQDEHVASDYRMGVFLCSPSNSNINFRMSLLWQEKIHEKQEASRFFGRIVAIAMNFQKWRTDSRNKSWEEKWLNDMENNSVGPYRYLSSNCCRLGDKVLRIYDNRVRETERRPDVYLECADIVGDGAEETFSCGELKCAGSSSMLPQSDGREEKGLRLISTPFRHGTHRVKNPNDFLLVIEQLEELHEKGFVHGDIRGFNIVFGKENAWLIDFDFGGKVGDVTYPTGYKDLLADGSRFTVEGGQSIEKSHDWIALVRYIFDYHIFCCKFPDEPDDADIMLEGRMNLLRKQAHRKDGVVNLNDVKELLRNLDEVGYSVEPNEKFEKAIKELEGDGKRGHQTLPGATGSPPKKIT